MEGDGRRELLCGHRGSRNDLPTCSVRRVEFSICFSVRETKA